MLSLRKEDEVGAGGGTWYHSSDTWKDITQTSLSMVPLCKIQDSNYRKEKIWLILEKNSQALRNQEQFDSRNNFPEKWYLSTPCHLQNMFKQKLPSHLLGRFEFTFLPWSGRLHSEASVALSNSVISNCGMTCWNSISYHRVLCHFENNSEQAVCSTWIWILRAASEVMWINTPQTNHLFLGL